MIESFRPEPEFIIGDLDVLKVIADPLRNQIIEALIRESLTVKQTADRLGLSPSKLYYHVNLLEQHGLIQVVETRMVANMVEKIYRARATSFRVDESLLSFKSDEDKSTLNSVITTMLDATREGVLRSLEAHPIARQRRTAEQPHRVILTRETSRISDSRANEFGKRLDQLLAEFDEADGEETAEQRQTYALTIAFYPSVYFPDESKDEGGIVDSKR